MLFLNATDLDRSREYGQESIIYSLEGSSQFRINARSGEPWSSAPQADSPYPAWGLQLGQVSSLSQEDPIFEQASFEHLVLSLNINLSVITDFIPPKNHNMNLPTKGCLSVVRSPVVCKTCSILQGAG